VHLTGKEYQMLELLSLRKGTTLTKEMFLNHLYGGMDEPELKIIDVFICKLRKKLAEATGGENYIETVWGRGYVLRDPAASGVWRRPVNGRGARTTQSAHLTAPPAATCLRRTGPWRGPPPNTQGRADLTWGRAWRTRRETRGEADVLKACRRPKPGGMAAAGRGGRSANRPITPKMRPRFRTPTMMRLKRRLPRSRRAFPDLPPPEAPPQKWGRGGGNLRQGPHAVRMLSLKTPSRTEDVADFDRPRAQVPEPVR
jgi:DNA-binding winged helix-turn-helix (wHTH) protein